MMPKRPQHHDYYYQKGCTAANLPKPPFILIRRSDTRDIHPVVGREEGKGQEHDGDTREDEDGFVLGVRDDGEFVLLNGAELEELAGGKELVGWCARGKGEGELTASIDCLQSITSLSKQLDCS